VYSIITADRPSSGIDIASGRTAVRLAVTVLRQVLDMTLLSTERQFSGLAVLTRLLAPAQKIAFRRHERQSTQYRRRCRTLFVAVTASNCQPVYHLNSANRRSSATVKKEGQENPEPGVLGKDANRRSKKGVLSVDPSSPLAAPGFARW
jgi:hypothetical protein